MRDSKTYIPLLIMLLVAGTVGYSLYNYEMPTFYVEANSETQTKTKELKPVELLERPEVQTVNPVGSIALSPAADESNANYKDGTYYGSGTGFGGTIRVKVIVNNGKISDINITSHSETPSYLSRARSVMSRIISAQSTNVDTVSGATYSSVGIINAVRDALSKAKVSDKDKTESSKKNTQNAPRSKDKKTKENKDNESVKTSVFPYPDGVYEGKAFGFSDYVKVKICLMDGRIEAIKIVSHGDDKDFFDKAKAVTDDILGKQKTKVDSISGATYSSKGIIKAVEDALAKAKKKADEESKKDSSDESSHNDTAEDSKKDESTIYKDGTYTATATCYPDDDEDFEEYNLTLSIVIENDKIKEVKDVTGDGDSSNQLYINRAATLMAEAITEKGNLDGVDAVSGATCTSKAITDACTQALYSAKK